MSELHQGSRSDRLDQAIHRLLAQTPELEAAAVVSFDGLPMAAALPPSMDEDRVAAMSAALLSLGERAAQGLGRGELSQVYIEGETGTVFLISADNEAVLVAVAAKGAKVGMMLYEVKRAAAVVAEVLRAEDDLEPAAESQPIVAEPVPTIAEPMRGPHEPILAAVPPLQADPHPLDPHPLDVPAAPFYVAEPAPAWSSYAPSGSVLPASGASIDVPGWS